MKLQVMMVDKIGTDIALFHQNECVPFRRRQITIELTPEQIDELKPRHTGNINGDDYFEEIGNVWIED